MTPGRIRPGAVSHFDAEMDGKPHPFPDSERFNQVQIRRIGPGTIGSSGDERRRCRLSAHGGGSPLTASILSAAALARVRMANQRSTKSISISSREPLAQRGTTIPLIACNCALKLSLPGDRCPRRTALLCNAKADSLGRQLSDPHFAKAPRFKRWRLWGELYQEATR